MVDKAGIYHIVFEYADAMSGWKWRRQECYVSSLRQCIEWYGLGKDCDYRIVSVEEIDNKEDSN